MSSFTQLRGTSEDGRMASMLQEGPDGAHVRGQADPGGTTPPLLRAARWCASPSLWARRGCPQALTPPSEGPGWLEKGGRKSSRSSPPYL